MYHDPKPAGHRPSLTLEFIPDHHLNPYSNPQVLLAAAYANQTAMKAAIHTVPPTAKCARTITSKITAPPNPQAPLTDPRNINSNTPN